MTLEHIAAPREFLDAVVRVVRRPNGVIFIQVPEAQRIVRDCAFEDIYYEHCSYFTAGSLSRLFRRLGLRVLSAEAAYDGQYLTVEAGFPGVSDRSAVDEPRFDDLSELSRHVAAFHARVRVRRAAWGQRLARWKEEGKRVAIWGSGSKGVAFLTGVPGAESIAWAIDIDPYRRGHYMPATAHRIIGPDDLRAARPDAIVVMNRVYVPEIRQMLADMALQPEVHAL
jgi:hypothetical protein